MHTGSRFFNTFSTLLCEKTDHFSGYLKPQDVPNTGKCSMQNWQNHSEFLILFKTVSVQLIDHGDRSHKREILFTE